MTAVRRDVGSRGEERENVPGWHRPLQIQMDSRDRKRPGMSCFGATFVESIDGHTEVGDGSISDPQRYIR